MIRIVLPLALILAGAASPASARNEENPPVRTVAFEDLDLSSASGQAQLDRRIGAAVGAVCGEAEHADFNGKVRVRRCREEARASADSQRRQAIAARSGYPNLALSR